MRYELTDLRVFMAIANAKSLTNGALDMHMTAPTASYRLKNLERAMGASLFNRTPKGMALTSAGETVYRYCQSVLSNIDQLHGEMRRYTSGVVGQVRVFANSSTLSQLPIPLSRFLAAYPNVNIDLEEHLSDETVRAVHDNMADIGLVASVVHLRGLESIEYGHDELVVITVPGHPLTKRERVTLDMMLQYDIVSIGRNSSNFLYLQQMANSLSCHMNVRVHVPNFGAALRCVQEGVGITLIPATLARPAVEKGLVDWVRLDEHWTLRQQMIVVRSFAALPDYVKAFIQYLQDYSIEDANLQQGM
ncbi:LysR family transcriptional regulator [Pusillimonas sp. ANT_WB101]|uniref:LysR family transcriptional regulator n=1 Tax=Pusillimonas sp. ANT_WB101 TaxID=2597356 RepID=UPI0011ED5B9F|nr:LysR family transcriptional regulator [Pusillimonas sp. ANT_WB101]KAA0892533.1 LysR family transcriptional regulator [Pusillimonas sp. ANT_WB101]